MANTSTTSKELSLIGLLLSYAAIEARYRGFVDRLTPEQEDDMEEVLVEMQDSILDVAGVPEDRCDDCNQYDPNTFCRAAFYEAFWGILEEDSICPLVKILQEAGCFSKDFDIEAYVALLEECSQLADEDAGSDATSLAE